MYTKVYASLITSSVWSEDPATCKVWVTLMAMADRGGIVFGSVSGLARICALPIPDVEAALRKFLAPDPYSSDLTRQPKNEGRRIEVVEGGWRLLNHAHYRDLPDADARREQVRQAAANFRNKKKAESNQPSSSVITSNQSNHASSRVSPSDAYTDAEAGSEAGSKAVKRDPSDLSGRPADAPGGSSSKSSADPEKRRRAEAIERVFAHYRKRFGKRDPYSLTPKRRQKIDSRLDELGEEAVIRAIDRASEDQWFREVCSSNGVESILRSQDDAEKWASKPPKGQPAVEANPLDDGWMEWAAEQQRALHEPGPGESER